MATIKDVARLAGVSTTTVSHVMNKTRFVAENTAKKVAAAVDELNYAPSAVARSLKSNSTRTIGMLVTKSTNQFFAQVIHGVEEFCYTQGYSLILCNTDGDISKLHDYLRVLTERRVDGLLIMCSDLQPKNVALLQKNKELPLIVMDWGAQDLTTDCIQDNAKEGGYIATQHFIENGHTKIACITGPLEKRTCQMRLEGFRMALAQAGLEETPDWIIEADFECESAVKAALQLLEQKERPTAVFCFNDTMALAAISAFRGAGLKIPEDMSIIGYDNIEIAPFFSPPLTTVHQPKNRLGKTAVKLLLERIANKENQQRIYELKPELVSRQSVKKIEQK